MHVKIKGENDRPILLEIRYLFVCYISTMR